MPTWVAGSRPRAPSTTSARWRPDETASFSLELKRSQIPVSAAGVYWFGAHALGNTTDARDGVADGRARTLLPLVPPGDAGPRARRGGHPDPSRHPARGRRPAAVRRALGGRPRRRRPAPRPGRLRRGRRLHAGHLAGRPRRARRGRPAGRGQPASHARRRDASDRRRTRAGAAPPTRARGPPPRRSSSRATRRPTAGVPQRGRGSRRHLADPLRGRAGERRGPRAALRRPGPGRDRHPLTGVLRHRRTPRWHRAGPLAGRHHLGRRTARGLPVGRLVVGAVRGRDGAARATRRSRPARCAPRPGSTANGCCSRRRPPPSVVPPRATPCRSWRCGSGSSPRPRSGCCSTTGRPCCRCCRPGFVPTSPTHLLVGPGRAVARADRHRRPGPRPAGARRRDPLPGGAGADRARRRRTSPRPGT